MGLDSLSFETILVILFAVAFLAGTVDAMAGGGGMITIPALLLCGVPPLYALGTNKFQASAGSLTATITLLRKGVVHFSELKWGALSAFLGSVLGTLMIQWLGNSQLQFIIPLILLFIGIYYLFSPTLGHVESHPRCTPLQYHLTAVPAIGFYDGFLGPGTGSFFALANITLRGMSIIRATAAAKLFNFATNFASLLLFIMGGKVLWSVGLVMLIGQICGAYLGSKALLRYGAALIRPMVVLVCFGMLARYIFQQYF